jgi:hypothetical protein
MVAELEGGEGKRCGTFDTVDAFDAFDAFDTEAVCGGGDEALRAPAAWECAYVGRR